MHHVLIDHRSRSCLEDVKVSTEAIISTMETFVDGELSGHRAVVAKLHCRLKAQTGNVPEASYIRSDCRKPDIQKKIQESLATDSPLNPMANTALVQAGYFGLDPESTDTPPRWTLSFRPSLPRPLITLCPQGTLPSFQQLAHMHLPIRWRRGSKSLIRLSPRASCPF